VATLNSLHSGSVKDQPRSRVLTSAPGRTRTCDQPLRRRLLYPLSYGGGAPILSHMRPDSFTAFR
jgi:hypothetical protein